jgi:kynurenine formamidase
MIYPSQVMFAFDVSVGCSAMSAQNVSVDEFLALTRRFSNWGRWGEDDELGTLNFITPDHVSRAANEVRTGQVFSLAIPFSSDGPQRGGFGRFNPIHLMLRDGGDVLSGAFRDFYGGVDKHIRGTDDMIIMPLQSATRWDSLAHIFHGEQMYNGYGASEVSSSGAKRNSIARARDKVAGRGVLLDIPRLKNRAWLEPGERITSEDLESAAAREGVQVQEGDLVLVRTGQMAMVRERGDWGDYAGGSAPGLALDSLEWIWTNRIAALATDTWGVEVLPNETPDVFQPFHIVSIVYMGLLLGEIFDLEVLADSCEEDGRYSFFFSALPLPISGAVGSPINPMAAK